MTVPIDKLPDVGASPWKHVLAYVLPFVVAIAGGFFGWITGVQPRLESHGKDIEALKSGQYQQGRQLERMDGKIDRLLEKRP